MASVTMMLFQPLQVVGHHCGGHNRITAKGTFADDDILGIGVHICHRGKVDIEAILLQVGADNVAAVVGI